MYKKWAAVQSVMPFGIRVEKRCWTRRGAVRYADRFWPYLMAMSLDAVRDINQLAEEAIRDRLLGL